eukprot:TRINITY_DN5581_c0_g1_i4.p1 TRINITY_DN5581_c0_g1~~TRINITY_DN5581_c0_g1_i4.p1  ORF type:complete len:389 (-),score=46.54 TRINITY_DN5581_c0_g1_i4:337-1503(-)
MALHETGVGRLMRIAGLLFVSAAQAQMPKRSMRSAKHHTSMHGIIEPGAEIEFDKFDDTSSAKGPASDNYQQLATWCLNPEPHLTGDLGAMSLDACAVLCDQRVDCCGFDSDGSNYCFLKGHCEGSPGSDLGYKKLPMSRICTTTTSTPTTTTSTTAPATTTGTTAPTTTTSATAPTTTTSTAAPTTTTSTTAPTTTTSTAAPATTTGTTAPTTTTSTTAPEQRAQQLLRRQRAATTTGTIAPTTTTSATAPTTTTATSTPITTITPTATTPPKTTTTTRSVTMPTATTSMTTRTLAAARASTTTAIPTKTSKILLSGDHNAPHDNDSSYDGSGHKKSYDDSRSARAIAKARTIAIAIVSAVIVVMAIIGAISIAIMRRRRRAPVATE